MREGTLGWARIENVHDTGLVDGRDAALMLDLTVHVPGREGYRISHTQVVPRRSLSGLRRGARVPVRVHPDDPHDLLLS